MRTVIAVIVLAASLLAQANAPQARSRGVGIDDVSIGASALHDHTAFNFFIHVLNDPYRHQFIQGYAFDGVDVLLGVGWHWGTVPLRTSLRVTPASREHFAFDQDTDFRPAPFTHGNAGQAKSRTFGINQQVRVADFQRRGRLSWELDFLRQWTRYHDVTTYDLSPSQSRYYTRQISERAVIYQTSFGLVWDYPRTFGAWMISNQFTGTPVSLVRLDNYVPILVIDQTGAFAVRDSITLTRQLFKYSFSMSPEARWDHSYSRQHTFSRQMFDVRLEVRR